MRTIILFLFFTSVLIFDSAASDITFMTHNLQDQTYLDKNGELRGKEHAGKRAFNLELVRELMIAIGHPREFSVVPFARGLKNVQSSSDFAFFNVSRTPSREASAKWVGPLQVETDYLYEMKSSPSNINTLEDAKKVDYICVLNGGVHHTTLKQKGFTNLATKASYVDCFKLLKRGRVNLTPSASSTVVKKLEKANISPNSVNQTPVVVVEAGGYIAFSKNVSDDVIAKWQDTFIHIKQSGKYEQLLKRYFLPK
ncbi:MAG: transporter substrate-binding domain-containing protein [Sedimenticola sp.]